jgi:hypothetical protein
MPILQQIKYDFSLLYFLKGEMAKNEKKNSKNQSKFLSFFKSLF